MKLNYFRSMLFQTIIDISVKSRPKVEVSDKKAPHDAVDLAKTGGKGYRRTRKSLDEAFLVLFAEKS